MDENRFHFNAGLTYRAPDLIIDESKMIVYNQYGEPTSVIKSNGVVRKPKHKKKKLSAKSKAYIVGSVSFVLAVLILVNIAFSFSPKKWSYEGWRRLIIFDLKIKTDMNIFEDFIVEWINSTNTNRDNIEKAVFIDGRDMFNKFSSRKQKYNLYFKTPDEVKAILGEENPHGYTPPKTPEPENKFTEYKAYYCYGNEKKAKWIVIKFSYGRSIIVEFNQRSG